MTEKGPSINMQSLETRFAVGKVEKPIENKIEDTARKIIGENILKDEGHASGFERDVKADGVVESLGYGFKTYADMLSAMNDPNRPAMKEKAGEAFDILRKSVSVAMNSGVDQELQTRLYVGTGKVEEVLPRPWREIHPGTPEVILAEAVVESVITDQNILKTVRQLDKVRTRVDVGNKNERELLAGKIETEVGNLLFMEVSEEKENELVAVKSFLSTEAGILRGELGVEDKSADKEDVMVVLGEKLTEVSEKIGVAADRLTDVAEKVDNIASTPVVNTEVDEDEKENKDTESGYDRWKYQVEKDPIKLRDIARKNLDQIEGMEELSNRYRLTGQPTEVLDKISFRLKNELIGNAKEELSLAERLNDPDKIQSAKSKLESYDMLRKEIQARLTIFDIGKLMSDVSFRTGDRGGMSDIIDQAAKMNRIMDREVMGFCFEESKKAGLNIAGAWDMIQEANFNYAGLLKKVWDSGLAVKSGKTEREFLALDPGMSLVPGREMGLFLDESYDPKRAEIVNEYIISQLGDNGRKSYQLANELVNATGERPAFNFAFIKGDGLCEAIYFKAFRDDDASKGKKVGPVSNRGVQSLAHGWIRYFARSTDLSDEMGPIKSSEIIGKLDEIKGKKDSIMYFCKIVPSYVMAVKNSLMDVDPDLKKILNISHLQELVASYDKVDVPYNMMKTANGWERAPKGYSGPVEKSRCGVNAMKVYYVLGLLELFATKENLGMDMVTMRKFRQVFVDTDLSDTKKPFINESQWKWILEQKIANNGKGKDLDFMQAMRLNGRVKMVEDFFDYFVSGGGKKR